MRLKKKNPPSRLWLKLQRRRRRQGIFFIINRKTILKPFIFYFIFIEERESSFPVQKIYLLSLLSTHLDSHKK